MRVNPRFLVATLLACSLVALSDRPASAQFSAAEQACRSTVAKNGTKLSKTILKALVSCHKSRAKDGALAGVDCNSIAEADTKSKVSSAQAKLIEAVSGPSSKCAGLTPSAVLYDACPAPCAGAISDFGDVADCVVCLARSNAESFSDLTQGTPTSPLTGDSAKCQAAIGKEGSKLYNTVLKDVTKCQSTAEKAGTDTVDGCTDTGFPSSKVEDAENGAFANIAEACAAATFTDLDSCGNTQATIADCVTNAALASGQAIVTQYLQLESGVPTTTSTTLPPTTTTLPPTTTTTLPATESHPQCPNVGELVLFSQQGETCGTNGDCAIGTCESGRCRTTTELDTGWQGIAHNSDINDQVLTRARLICPGPPSPGCGECVVDGVDPAPGNCRCASDTRAICDTPFGNDADDCGGGLCECYFGSPFPLSSGGTPACVVNRFAVDISGTANVDLGEGEITANLKSQVFLGISTTNPCPLCGGKCSNDTARPCDVDADCVAPGTCGGYDTAADGVRGGLCMGGRNAGASCDINGNNTSFPAYPGGSGAGAGYSLDCLPDVGKNVSGAGLTVNLTQTTGTATLESFVQCGSAAPGEECPCKTCSNAVTEPCNKDSDCVGSGTCALQTGGTRDCTDNASCASRDVGPCLPAPTSRCQRATSFTCANNSECLGKNVGPCNLPTCSSIGGGVQPKPNSCTGLACTDVGGGEGECTTGPDTIYCDGVTKANGDGILTCNPANGTADCEPAAVGINAGACTIFDRNDCFLDPIVATGAASPTFPVGAAAFCVPPTASPSINSVAGLPGPGRVRNQGASATFCASDNNVQYQPGVGGCPAP